MKIDFFWNQWNKTDRRIYLILSFAFALLLLVLFIQHWLGIISFFDWNELVEALNTDVIINTLSIGPFKLGQEASTTYFLQKYSGTAPLIKPIFYHLFAIIVGLALTILIAIISSMSRFWFYIGIALFSFILVSLKLELLLLFHSNEKIGLITALVLYLPAAYYFNRIKTDLSIWQRILIFLVITSVLSIFIASTSTLPLPFFYLSTSMTTAATVMGLVFIFTIGHEIVAGFAFILFGTGTNTTKGGTIHFLIISVIYLINVLLAYLNEAGILHLNIFYLDPLLLLVISSILGIWGFRHREFQYNFVIPFQPSGGLAYLIFGLVCFATIFHFYVTGNDVGLEIFRDFIFYTQLGFGLIFILYVLANFGALLKSKLAIYKVIYKPTNMPYFTFRFAGFIVVIALVLRANWQVPVYQNNASTFNAIGDYHYYTGDKKLAERYYIEGSNYARFNHKSNYTIAIINERQNNAEKAIVRYKEALQKYPTAQAYANLSKIYSENNRFFDALFTLRDGLKKFPDNYQLNSLIGLLYSNTNVIDSALYFTHYAHELNPNHQGAVNNLLALLAANDLAIAVDSVAKEYVLPNEPITINNTLVLANNNRDFRGISFSPRDSVLSPLEASLLINNTINHLLSNDTLSAESIKMYVQHEANANYDDELDYILSQQLYHNGRVNEAFRTLNWSANTSQKTGGKYFDDIGLWALQQGAPKVAVQYFRWAVDRDYEDAEFHLAIALSESKNTDALGYWSNLYNSGNGEVKNIAQSILALQNGAEALYSDLGRYLYIRYQLTYQDTLLFNQIVDTIEDDNYKAASILEMAEELWSQDLSDAAIACYARLADMQITDDLLFENVKFFELNALAYQGQLRMLANSINDGVTFTSRRLSEKAYYTALLANFSGDSIKAEQNFNYLAYRNPFYEEATIAAAAYFNQKDPFKAYDILLSAIEINPNDLKLSKAYILQCADILKEEYAEPVLLSLREALTDKEFNDIQQLYTDRLEKAYLAFYGEE